MTVTVEEAQTSLAEILAKAEAGEEILIGRDVTHPLVKLVPVTQTPPRLARHPDLVGSTKTVDPAALVTPLPPEEWGELGTH